MRLLLCLLLFSTTAFAADPIFQLNHYSVNGEGVGSIGPLYMVQVHEDGRVIYQGRKHVRITSGQHLLSPQELREFISLLSEVQTGFSAFSSSPEAFLLGPIAVMEVTLDGKKQRAEFNRRQMTAYSSIREAMEPYLKTLGYRCPIDSPNLNLGMNVGTVDVCSRINEVFMPGS